MGGQCSTVGESLFCSRGVTVLLCGSHCSLVWESLFYCGGVTVLLWGSYCSKTIKLKKVGQILLNDNVRK